MDRKGWLVLSRKVGTEIQIGESVMVRVLSVKGRVVKLGLAAPEDVHIRRGEVQKREAA